ncbi:MAG: hypothetical protein J5871_06260 [Bacteroidales bacterium]|nr:hypothetical protein [Bacteroidales bacterium]
MSLSRSILLYPVLLAAQILLCVFFDLSPYLLLSILPVLILCLPIRMGGIPAMFLAFCIGFAVDFFSDGMLGISSLALVPTAFFRRSVIRLVFGEEVFARGEDISLGRQGLPKFALAILMSCALYFLVYIWADAAGTGRFWMESLRLLLSVLGSTVLSLVIVGLLTGD